MWQSWTSESKTCLQDKEPIVSTSPAPTPPYKGLVPYYADDAEFFFGRERERNFITANLLAERLTLLYGASGVGKSSVLRAGVENHIRQLAKENLQRLGKPKYVIIIFNEWRDSDPVRSLLAKVEETVRRTLTNEQFDPVNRSLSLTEALLEWSKRVRGQLLIILDQFEEYFLYHQDEDGPGTFAEEFPNAVKYVGLPANFLVSFREDAFSKLTFFKVRMPDVFGNYLRLHHLDYDAGRDAITKPIEQYNRTFANGHPVSIEPALVEEVLKQVETGQVILGDAGRGTLKKETTGAQIETPFLQMVMMRLWEDEQKAGSPVLRLATLEKLADEETHESGSVRIVRTHLDEKMDTLSLDQQNTAADVFNYLVTPSGAKIAHTAEDLAKYAGVQKNQLEPTLEKLATWDMRILRATSGAGQQPRYEIFHDVMALPILDWRNRRMDKRRADEQRSKALEKAREEEQARSARRLRVFASVLAVMCVAAVLFAVVAWRQREKATRASQEAIANYLLAQSQTAIAQKKSDELAKANADLDTARKEAVAKSDLATEKSKLAEDNEKKARKEAAQAKKNLQTAVTQIKGDLTAANEAYFYVPDERDPCNRQDQLRAALTQYCNLLDRYVALQAKQEIDFTRQKIKQINDDLRRVQCDLKVPYEHSKCETR